MQLRQLRRRRFALPLAVFLGLSGFTLGALAIASGLDPAAPPHPAAGNELRLGYFSNLTHATAIVGVERGLFAKELGGPGGDVKLTTATFNAGPSAIEALLSGAIDASYIGPNPAVNAFVKSNGKAVRVIAGATSGGAFLVVDPAITKPEDLKGKKVASPQLGNTQDVALRAWLRDHGMPIDLKSGKGEVTVVPQENGLTLDAFKQRQIAGAWVPEPWASRLILEGGGKVLVDERDLWPDRQYVTTHLLVRTDYLEKNPDVVKRLLRGHVESGAWIAANAAEARKVVNDSIGRITGKPIGEELLLKSLGNLTFTNDPIAGSLEKSAKDAASVGLLDLEGLDVGKIYELSLLNAVLAERGLSAIQS